MAGGKKRKGAKAGRTNKKKQRQAAKPIEQPSPISRLYQDALQSVFDFCSLPDLSRVMCVSRSWSASVNQMPCSGFSFRCTTLNQFIPVCSSALSKHIQELSFASVVKLKLTCEALYTLALRMPQLIRLECGAAPSSVTKVILPPRLQTLKLGLSQLDAAAINTTITGVSQLPALVTLEFTLPSFLPAISFAPLAAVASLRDLELRSALIGSHPTRLHLRQLRALPQLRRMNGDGLSSQALAQLLRTPHDLLWQEIHMVKNVDVAGSAALSSLRSLTTLNTLCCTNIGFLAHLVQLRKLNLHMAQAPWPATITADAVIDGLSVCTQLTDLTLTAPLNNKHLSVVLPRLPLLTSLCLWYMSEMEALAFLSRGPIVHRLRSLDLLGCRNAALDPSELQHVYALTALENLTIEDSFAGEPLSKLELWLHTPPSKLMPQLKRFTYTAPLDDDDEDDEADEEDD